VVPGFQRWQTETTNSHEIIRKKQEHESLDFVGSGVPALNRKSHKHDPQSGKSFTNKNADADRSRPAIRIISAKIKI
jgi:hypothetical protein